MRATAARGSFPFRHLTLAEVAELERLGRLRLERFGPRWARYLSLRRRKVVVPREGPEDAA